MGQPRPLFRLFTSNLTKDVFSNARETPICSNKRVEICVVIVSVTLSPFMSIYLPEHSPPLNWLSMLSSDSVWPNGWIFCSMFGHLEQCKFAKYQITTQEMAKYFLKFRRSGEISPNLVTLLLLWTLPPKLCVLRNTIKESRMHKDQW